MHWWNKQAALLSYRIFSVDPRSIFVRPIGRKKVRILQYNVSKHSTHSLVFFRNCARTAARPPNTWVEEILTFSSPVISSLHLDARNCFRRSSNAPITVLTELSYVLASYDILLLLLLCTRFASLYLSWLLFFSHGRMPGFRTKMEGTTTPRREREIFFFSFLLFCFVRNSETALMRLFIHRDRRWRRRHVA